MFYKSLVFTLIISLGSFFQNYPGIMTKSVPASSQADPGWKSFVENHTCGASDLLSPETSEKCHIESLLSGGEKIIGDLMRVESASDVLPHVKNIVNAGGGCLPLNISSSYAEVFRCSNENYHIYPKGEASEYVILVPAFKFKDPEGANRQFIKVLNDLLGD